MSRIYQESNYYGGDSMSSIDEYLERVNRLQRMPTVNDDYSDIPVHRSPYPEKHNDHNMKIFHANSYQPAPEVHKKVHFTEKSVEIDRSGKHQVYDEKAIDVEADGFIQKRHRHFESSSTFKV
ncbi:hypothetical protein ACS0TY_034900 [Phlomoides rotata]